MRNGQPEIIRRKPSKMNNLPAPVIQENRIFRNYINSCDFDKQAKVTIKKVYKQFDNKGVAYDLFKVKDGQEFFLGTVETIGMCPLYGGTYVFKTVDGKTFGPSNGTAQAPSGACNVEVSAFNHLLRNNYLN